MSKVIWKRGSFVFNKTTSCRQRIDVSQQLIKCVSNLYPFKRIWKDKEKEDISNHLMYNGYDVFSCNLISFEFLFWEQEAVYGTKANGASPSNNNNINDYYNKI